MNKHGFTLIELLISIALISVCLLLILRVMLMLENINYDPSYASSDEIRRTEIIKNIESDFLTYHLNGLDIIKNDDSTTILFHMDEEKSLTIKNDTLTYNDEAYTLRSDNATYNLCPSYKYLALDNDYYLISLTIPVLINNENTTTIDDLELTYIGLRNEFTNYPPAYSC